ncbi:4681_t:CDS:2 [Entrophospora sp. SA101]|nr:11039_t:CDS:2 [Entrophospora sp. SA101]CAJ0838959.1 15773_t:CDS:2 [Entrophospora sp. SA101]CAJ0886814.1 4681_t:CDS:2 [Entrophospora sp. SA101]
MFLLDSEHQAGKSVESDKSNQEEPVKICSAGKECGADFADNDST